MWERAVRGADREVGLGGLEYPRVAYVDRSYSFCSVTMFIDGIIGMSPVADDLKLCKDSLLEDAVALQTDLENLCACSAVWRLI